MLQPARGDIFAIDNNILLFMCMSVTSGLHRKLSKILTILTFSCLDVIIGCINKMLVTVSENRKSLI